ncbi:MAG: hypothetical protein ACUVTX_06920 [Bacteroidales bacterium]
MLQSSKPKNLGEGVFAILEESWPQVNEQLENELRESIEKIAKTSPDKILAKLNELNHQHQRRRGWVWSELGNLN